MTALLAGSSTHRWQHSLFWLMFGADMLLVGVTAVSFPGATGGRLVLMVFSLLLASFLLNLALTPADQRPVHLARSGGRASVEGEGAVRLLQYVLGAQEEERARVARELRELVAQPLVGIGYQLSAVTSHVQGTPIGADFEVARESVRHAAEEIAMIADELYPGLLGELGLVAALESLRRRVTRRSSLRCDLTVEGEPFMLSLPLTRAFYRFAEESLENVERHAGAKSAAVRLSFARQTVTLEISDTGRGFRADRPRVIADGVGLRLARELLACEGATMQIDSVPGRGTRVTATATVPSEDLS